MDREQYFACYRKLGGIYTVKSSQGKGGGFEPLTETRLTMDEETHWITADGLYRFQDQAEGLRDHVAEVVNASGSEDWLTSNDLAKLAKIQRSLAGSAGRMAGEARLIDFKKEGRNRFRFRPLRFQTAAPAPTPAEPQQPTQGKLLERQQDRPVRHRVQQMKGGQKPGLAAVGVAGCSAPSHRCFTPTGLFCQLVFEVWETKCNEFGGKFQLV